MAKSPVLRIAIGLLGIVPILAVFGVGTYITNGFLLVILLSAAAIVLAAFGLLHTIGYIADGHLAADLDDLLRRGGR